jgi:hypothetical protein
MQRQAPAPQGSAPSLPFTEPVLENPEPKMEEMAAILTEEKPERRTGFLGFVDSASEEIGSWFGDSEASPYPSLSSIPEPQGYNKNMQEMQQTTQELESYRDAAQKQRATITDWSQLAEDPKPAPATAVTEEETLPHKAIAMPATIPAPTPTPQPEKIAEPAPTIVIAEPTPTPVIEEPAPAPEPQAIVIDKMDRAIETRPEYLRAPTPATVDLLPANRYATHR